MSQFDKGELGLLHGIIEDELQKRRVTFDRKIRQLTAELASKGIGASGAAIQAYERETLDEADQRADLIVSLIKQSVMETTYHLDDGDLLAVFDSLTPIDIDLVAPIVNAFKVARFAGSAERAASVKMAISSKIAGARLKVVHFAGAPRRANTATVNIHGDVGNVQNCGVAHLNQQFGTDTGTANGEK